MKVMTIAEATEWLPPGLLHTDIELFAAYAHHWLGRKARTKGCGWRQGRPKNCYANAMRLALKDPKRFTYCEGFGMHGDFYGIPHAWVEDYDGLVVDPTWVLDGRECQYMGLRFDFMFASELVFGSGRFGLGIEIPGTITRILDEPLKALRLGIGLPVP